jgi:flavin reductase (DIM6/NTAB) family NADH-FMN oxidoreductase RutF
MKSDMAALFRRITLGVYVIGVAGRSARDAFTAASVSQASYQPLTLSLAINPKHASYPLLQESGAFAVNVLGENQIELARHFGTAPPTGTDKMQGHAWRRGQLGAPLLESALAWFECRVVGEMPAGDHHLVLGRVVGGELRHPTVEPLHYARTGNLDGSEQLYPDQFSG